MLFFSEAFNKVVSDLGGLDILFNNAGVHGYVEPRERVIGINLVRWIWTHLFRPDDKSLTTADEIKKSRTFQLVNRS